MKVSICIDGWGDSCSSIPFTVEHLNTHTHIGIFINRPVYSCLETDILYNPSGWHRSIQIVIQILSNTRAVDALVLCNYVHAT